MVLALVEGGMLILINKTELSYFKILGNRFGDFLNIFENFDIFQSQNWKKS